MGCRFGQPHNMMLIKDGKNAKWERCVICNKKFRWNKGYKQRVHNTEYLKAHVRNYAQRTGPTKGVYNRIYKPQNCVIKI